MPETTHPAGPIAASRLTRGPWRRGASRALNFRYRLAFACLLLPKLVMRVLAVQVAVKINLVAA